MLGYQENRRTLRIGLNDAGDYPTVDISAPSENNSLHLVLIANAPAFGAMVAQFVRDHTQHTSATLREAALIEVTETQLL